MTKKNLDESAIVNELKGSSRFFQKDEDLPIPDTPLQDRATATTMPLATAIEPEPVLPTSSMDKSPQANLNEPEEDRASPIQTNMDVCMHEVMQELEDLKRAGVQSLSVRVTAEDFKWLRHITNSFNDELNKKFNQGLFIRIGLKLLSTALKYDPPSVKQLLREIK
jgi:hypothetical protein